MSPLPAGMDAARMAPMKAIPLLTVCQALVLPSATAPPVPGATARPQLSQKPWLHHPLPALSPLVTECAGKVPLTIRVWSFICPLSEASPAPPCPAPPRCHCFPGFHPTVLGPPTHLDVLGVWEP